MADSGMSKVLLIGGAAVAAWWFFFRTPTAAAPAAPAAPAGGSTGGTPAASTPPAPPVVAYNSLDALGKRVAAAASAAGVPAAGVGPDAWNTFVVSQGGPNPAPDPLAVFPGVDRSQPMTFAQYWAGESAYLASKLGMSGPGLLGLGCMMSRGGY